MTRAAKRRQRASRLRELAPKLSPVEADVFCLAEGPPERGCRDHGMLVRHDSTGV